MRILLLACVVVRLSGCVPVRSVEPAASPRPASPSPSIPAADARLKRAAERMIHAAEETLAPVYPTLAEQLVEDLDLAGKQGVGIDLGIRDVRIHLPHPPGADVNYGLWVEFLKPREAAP